MTSFDYIALAIGLGMRDSLNPYMLGGILCVLIFWGVIGTTPKAIIRAGRLTVLSLFVTTFFVSGKTDTLWLEPGWMSIFTGACSLAIAVFLLVSGYLIFRQWWQQKRSLGTPPRLAVFFVANKENSPIPAGKRAWGIAGISIALGLMTALVSALWPKDQNFYIAYYLLVVSNDLLLLSLFFSVYSLAFTLCFILIWWATVCIKRSATLLNDFIKAISWLQISFSAVVIAVGMGLIYIYIVHQSGLM